MKEIHMVLQGIKSVPNRQNPVLLLLEKLRYRALKFLVHFSSGFPTKVPQRQSKVVTYKK